MNALWGEFEGEEAGGSGSSDEVIPGEVVKYLVMKAMHQDPYLTPPPTRSQAQAAEIDLLSNETQGLEIDDRVIHVLKLMQHAREMDQLLEAAREQTDLLADSQIQGLPPASEIPDHPVPGLKHTFNFPLQYMNKEINDFTRGKSDGLPEISYATTKQLLSKSVAALLALAGFNTTTESILATVADVVEEYIKKMLHLLRVAVDQGTGSGATGFPDAMERVFTELRIGGVRELHNYYQNSVIRTHERMLEECKNLNVEYCSLPLTIKQDPLNLDHMTFRKMEEADDVPEIHFPALGEDGVDELQPSLEPGFQMLHSLEQEVQLQALDSQDDGTNANESPDAFEIQSNRKRKRV